MYNMYGYMYDDMIWNKYILLYIVSYLWEWKFMKIKEWWLILICFMCKKFNERKK